MSISKRLLEIAKYISRGDIVGDIGSDHGYLPLYLFENNIINKGYACDNKRGPYLNLKSSFENKPYNIEIALNDGINNIPSYVDTLSITGMGGELITLILFSNPLNLKFINKMVLSPQGNEEMLRKALNNHGYKIIDEKIIFDDKYYLIMKIIKGDQSLTPLEYKYGPILLKNRDNEFINMLNEDIKYHQNLILNQPLSQSRKQEFLNHIDELERIIKNEF